jgi:vacuolar protein sorting-associated protein 41
MAVGEGSSSPDNDEQNDTQHDGARDPPKSPSHHSDHDPEEEEDNTDDGDEEDDEDEEPRLKYANLTKNLGSLYKNGEMASSFFVAGEKLIIATHQGNINVLAMPTLETMKRYSAHTASVTSISISPYPPPLPTLKLDAPQRLVSESIQQERESSPARPSPTAKGSPRQPPVAQTAANQIYIATSSIDGNVCVQSLTDANDVQLRNFGRPVMSVALSPEYRSDKAYLSGGRAGSLVLTVGGQVGKSTNATTTGTAAAASSWLGSIGLAANSGTDKVLHSGEGTISTIRWSLSGKFVLWVNEQGIKIMRSNLHLPSSQAGLEWKRFSHIDRPNTPSWEEMAGVWRAKVEWIDRNNLESDNRDPSGEVEAAIPSNGSAPAAVAGSQKDSEEVLVGWGDSIWMIRVFPGDENAPKSSGEAKPHVTVLRK